MNFSALGEAGLTKIYRKWDGDSEWILSNSTTILAERTSQTDGSNYVFSAPKKAHIILIHYSK